MTQNHELQAAQDRTAKTKRSSEKSFGLLCAIIFGASGILHLWKNQNGIGLLIAAAFFCLIAYLKPQLLKPLNTIWLQFGKIMHQLVSPFLLGSIFFCVLAPLATLMRLCKKKTSRFGFLTYSRKLLDSKIPRKNQLQRSILKREQHVIPQRIFALLKRT